MSLAKRNFLLIQAWTLKLVGLINLHPAKINPKPNIRHPK